MLNVPEFEILLMLAPLIAVYTDLAASLIITDSTRAAYDLNYQDGRILLGDGGQKDEFHICTKSLINEMFMCGTHKIACTSMFHMYTVLLLDPLITPLRELQIKRKYRQKAHRITKLRFSFFFLVGWMYISVVLFVDKKTMEIHISFCQLVLF